MASVLGKRARTTETIEETSKSSRVKRRAPTSLVNDENVAPDGINAEFSSKRRDTTSPENSTLVVCQENGASPRASTQRLKVGALTPKKPQSRSKVYEESSDVENNVQLPTPKTPRHRNTLSKRVPVTPRHRIGLIGKTQKTSSPHVPSTPNDVRTAYHHARQLFTKSSDPDPLIGREDERKALHTFVGNCVSSRTGRALYVSGPPGTGKSALVSEVCRKWSKLDGVKSAHINCMSANCSTDILGKLFDQLADEAVEIHGDSMATLRNIFLPKKKHSDFAYIVVLDEIDHLLQIDLEILYTLFEWSLQKRSRLVMIGIANALDLTDRFLPRLKTRNLRPQLLPFLPYTAPQIAAVVTTKLISLLPGYPAASADHVPFIQPTAIQLCSKKVASQGGDLRKAFDIIRRTIDLTEKETKQRFRGDPTNRSMSASPSRMPLGENPNLSSSPSANLTLDESLAQLTASTAPRATIAHLSRVCATAFGNGTAQRLHTLNLQQRAALLTLISLQRDYRRAASSIFTNPSKKGSAPLIRRVFESYCSLCKKDNFLQPVTNTEFLDIIAGLESTGLIGEEVGKSLGGIGGTPSRKVGGIAEGKRMVCFVNEDEFRQCLQGPGYETLLGFLDSDT